MEQKHIPDFLRKYHEGSDEEGKIKIEQLANSYELERQEFMQTTFVTKSIFQADWNRLTGRQDQVDPDFATSHIRDAFGERGKTLAEAHGYQEPTADSVHEEDQPSLPNDDVTESQDQEQSRANPDQQDINIKSKEEKPQRNPVKERRRAKVNEFDNNTQSMLGRRGPDEDGDHDRQAEDETPEPTPNPAPQDVRQQYLQQLNDMREQQAQRKHLPHY